MVGEEVQGSFLRPHTLGCSGRAKRIILLLLMRKTHTQGLIGEEARAWYASLRQSYQLSHAASLIALMCIYII